MTKSSIQHIVPQSYLRLFSYREKGKAFYVHVFDKHEKRFYSSNIINVACESDYYKLPNIYKEQQVKLEIVDDKLKDIEDKYSQNLKLLISQIDNKENLDFIVKEFFSYYIIIQFLRCRTPLEYNLYNAKRKYKYPDLIVNELMRKELGDDYNEQIAYAAYLSQIMDEPGIHQKKDVLIHKFKWQIGICPDNEFLFTSDVPIVNKAYESTNFKGAIALLMRGQGIAFPLNPKYLLMLNDSIIYANHKKSKIKYLDLSTEEVKYYNKLQVAQSIRQIISNNRSTLDYAEKLLCVNPAFAESNPQRF